MEGTDDRDFERELREAQVGVTAAREATRRRQEVVAAAYAAGWSKYKIAATLGVKAPTVDSILKAAGADGGQ